MHCSPDGIAAGGQHPTSFHGKLEFLSVVRHHKLCCTSFDAFCINIMHCCVCVVSFRVLPAQGVAETGRGQL